MFVEITQIEVNDLPGGEYSINRNVRFRGPILRSDLCDSSAAYIVAIRTKDLIAAAANKNGKFRKTLSLKTMCHLGHAYQKIMTLSQIMFADIDRVMSMYNLLEYSEKYLVTSGSLWKCYRDEIDIEVDTVDNNDSKTKSFKYITKIIGKTPAQSS